MDEKAEVEEGKIALRDEKFWFQLSEKKFGRSSSAPEQKRLEVRKHIRPKFMSSLQVVVSSANDEEDMIGRNEGTRLLQRKERHV